MEKYKNDTPFLDEAILTAENMNFIAKNINAIITALTWSGEPSDITPTALVSNVQMGDAT